MDIYGKLTFNKACQQDWEKMDEVVMALRSNTTIAVLAQGKDDWLIKLCIKLKMETASRTYRKKTAEERAFPGNDSGDIQDLPTECTGDDEHVEVVNQFVPSEPVRFQRSSPQNIGTYLTEQNLRPPRIALSPRGSRAAPVAEYCQPGQWSSDYVGGGRTQYFWFGF
ncbi:hypothetical protein BWQ96_08965 [Gracilariopsis chorda]|uniref:Uncharacterized protein n=1 Tax=Gracilariopsis chorda TaxID=448386 RepID=A0A2V3IH02_9FLOR|nr:hypothetical protein BWQ96_08965 [Gracilariopsis chorda]|eukprot:PXF41318.1 hypothetical protein BWQ96_08965 [Gracilariopsis chorda]